MSDPSAAPFPGTPAPPPGPEPTLVPAATRTGTLALLAFANFAIGMGAFVVIGVLSPVAADLRIGPAEAGRLLSVYALVYAVASPLLVALTGRWDRTGLLLSGIVVFGIGAALCAAAGSLATALAARMVMGVGGAVVTPVAASVAVAQVPTAQRGRALSIVFGGLTLAQAIGVPAGAWLGYAWGWRAAFGVVAVLCVLVALAAAWRLPRGVRVPVATLASLGTVLRSGRLALAVGFTAVFIGALYVPYTYVAPLLESRYGLGRNGVTLVLLIYGAAAVAGNAVGGWLTDRIGPTRTLRWLVAAQVLCMPLLTLWPLPLPVFVLLLTVWSLCGWSFMVPQQARLAALAPQQLPVLLALNASAIYAGSSAGSTLGGVTLGLAGFAALGVVGAVIVGLSGLALRGPAPAGR